MELTTLPQKAAIGVPVETIRVDVIEGPDVGKKLKAETDILSIGTATGNDLVLTDPTVSRFHLDLQCVPSGILVRDHDSTNGIYAGQVKIHNAVVPAGTILKIGQTTLKLSEGQKSTVPMFSQNNMHGILGEAASMRRLMAQIEQIAKTDTPVLLNGESGTGKELFAKAIHDLSPRAKKPFVVVDCASISATLVASELFGHEKGAFTGADSQRIGAFEDAAGGTIFLDEIGELPVALQPALLGVLERRRFRRLGGQQEISIDVRIVSATHRDLRTAVNTGHFRLDLYYRLAVVAMVIPALRERAEDIPLLVEHFLRELGFTGPPESILSEEAMKVFRNHRWPGNVRELRNLIEATVALGTVELPREKASNQPATPSDDMLTGLLGLAYKDARTRWLNTFELRYLTSLLERTDRNVAQAAREAKMDRSYLIDLIRKHQLK